MISTLSHPSRAAQRHFWILPLQAFSCAGTMAATPDNLSQGGAAGSVAAKEQAATPLTGGGTGIATEPRQMGMEAYEKGELAKAVEYLGAAHTLDPKDAEVSGRLGFALKETGGYEKAVTVLTEVIAANADNYYYWWWLSDAQRLLGRYKEALESMRKAQDVAPLDTTKELQQYVDYTASLADGGASWENFAKHVEFAKRQPSLTTKRSSA